MIIWRIKIKDVTFDPSNQLICNSRICMITHVVTAVMAKIRQLFLVTIEIDTEKAKPFPDGFKDPATNNGDNGLNWNTYPNWELNYQGSEYTFIHSVWADFRTTFKCDGLKCRIVAVDSEQFGGN